MSPQEVQERLELSALKEKIWYVVPSCATTGEGLFEGLVGFNAQEQPLKSGGELLTERIGLAL